jgi:hypothetical protein
MKKINFITILMVCLTLSLSSCSEDDPTDITVDENGLTRDITDLVPQAILDEMETLGMPINGGVNPPDIEGIFTQAPVVLLASNIENDNIGTTYASKEIAFSNQNNDNLTVNYDGVEYDSDTGNIYNTREGFGGFLVGDGCNFTIFIEVISTDNNDHTNQLVEVYSGCISEEGITDLHNALFMIDDNGDPSNVYIENGQGRVFYDSDGLSERTQGEERPVVNSNGKNASLQGGASSNL